MSTTLFSRYSQFEDGLIHQFHSHPLYKSFHKLSKEQFINYLLQIGFISQNFVKWYETAKLGMQSEEAREVIRHILRDEIPQQGSTHQDDRLYDLNLMGVNTKQVRNVVPSAVTRGTVESLYKLVRYPQDDYDLHVMITLRVAGEVLVAEQYQHVVRYMRVNFGIKPSQSHFYFPHWKHDLKGAKSGGNAGHTNAFDELLESMITDVRTLGLAMDVARKAFNARSSIHDQFVKRPHQVIMQVVGVLATLILTVFVGTSLYHKVMEPSYHQFLATLDPQARDFFLDCDRSLIERVKRTGKTELLAKVGTFESAHEVWGDGP